MVTISNSCHDLFVSFILTFKCGVWICCNSSYQTVTTYSYQLTIQTSQFFLQVNSIHDNDVDDKDGNKLIITGNITEKIKGVHD